MNIEQVRFDFTAQTLAEVKLGECFSVVNPLDADLVYMRVAPVQSLVHSHMVHEVLTRGDCFVVNTKTGMLTVMKHNKAVTKLSTKLQYALR